MNGNKLKGTYKKVDDDSPGEDIYELYRNFDNDTPKRKSI